MRIQYTVLFCQVVKLYAPDPAQIEKSLKKTALRAKINGAEKKKQYSIHTNFTPAICPFTSASLSPK